MTNNEFKQVLLDDSVLMSKQELEEIIENELTHFLFVGIGLQIFRRCIVNKLRWRMKELQCSPHTPLLLIALIKTRSFVQHYHWSFRYVFLCNHLHKKHLLRQQNPPISLLV